MTKVPFPPFDDRPVTRRTWGVGMDYGDATRTGATIRHTMVGWLASTDTYFRYNTTGALTPWGIGTKEDGPDLDGKIYRWLDVTEDNNVVPWSSGPFLNGGYDQFADYFVPKYGGVAVNNRSEAIEVSGLVNTVKSPAALSSLIHLEAAIKSDAGIDADEFLWSFEHWEVCGKGYKTCAFDDINNHREELNQGIVHLMNHYHHGKDVPESINIGGRIVPLVLGQQGDGPVNVPKPPIFVQFAKRRTFHVNGQATGRRYASLNAPIRHTYPTGSKFTAIGYAHGAEVHGDDRWLITSGPSKLRVHVSGVKEQI